MKTITIIKEGKTYKALKTTRNNLGEVEWFTNGEIKCTPEYISATGMVEIWCFKGDSTFWIMEGGYFLKDDKGVIDIMTESEFDHFPVLELNHIELREETIWEMICKFLNIRR